MTWYLVLYIMSSIIFSMGAGFTFVRREERNGWSYREEDFSFGAFFIAIALCIIAGMFLFKYKIL